MTIKDVAAYCGVSVSTVSRALNKHPDVSPHVREKVEEAVRELHYVPNTSARDLVRAQTDTVGLIARGTGNLFYPPVISSVERAVEAEGSTLITIHIPSDDDELTVGAELVKAKRLKGLILLGGRFDYSEEDLANIDVPLVLCTFSNNFGTLSAGHCSSVSINDEEEACKAVRNLIERGHRRIAIVLDSVRSHSIGELRFLGYKRALEESGIGIDPELILEIGNFDMHKAYSRSRALAESRTDFTALFAISDSLGMAAIKGLNDGGLLVPEDCSVIAIDGIEISRYCIPTLTTLIQPTEEIGKKAVALLMYMIRSEAIGKQLILETSLREGESVRSI
ncbi:MAG: LacI family transcriptional regulator [Lachnospiraceae bacterium]|nr:LacI family transcriptional regulator [Lachnospiraceae bacterium]